MPRFGQLPDCPPLPHVNLTSTVRAYDIELITPMFGGGVSTQTNDPSFPIRPTAIRGQLQFWWRATVGAQYAKPEELRSAQSAVWGDTTQASRVQVRVDKLVFSAPTPCAQYDRDRHDNSRYRSIPTWKEPFNKPDLSYVLFPFQGKLESGRKTIETEPASCIHSASFRLTVLCHKSIDFEQQVEPALWAWVNFGGLGSRTRRGCGAIRCPSLIPEHLADLISKARAYLTADQPKGWPVLAQAFLVGKAFGTASDAWSDAIHHFRHFRQGEGVGRNPGQPGANRPGRSRYPEPETIRRITGHRSPRHARLNHIPDDAFPRAELGLPIVFHFQDQKNGEPPDTVLYPDDDPQGNERERMASPLILKPVALQDGNFVPLIVRLKTPTLTGVALHQQVQQVGPLRIRHPDLATYPNSPLAGSPNGSAIEAFLAYAKSKGFTEVTR
ncbi:type III-B CRISPR module RAMP protein Cmr1 [Chloracidobacterium validum]|uniref:Type III-B CRISPR module RAMP protein Cmr1 n=1 Tax=Chloracidobacterium validum TaxID=2821543 RepID=A0ABX8B6A3_9BACT|nr:type III-B CRISPR module RAMP protein Cmr1 [Chloracidobacterium validum]QUW02502.1 type III-B CRISPR module RAMP protein Cmr1 [Chloracidobacterium validum]